MQRVRARAGRAVHITHLQLSAAFSFLLRASLPRLRAVRPSAEMFSILESVAFDTGYAGSNGLEPQSWVNGNGTSYIYFGSGEFDGQGSGHDFSGTLYMPPSGYVNSCDGGRSHTYCDYRQE